MARGHVETPDRTVLPPDRTRAPAGPPPAAPSQEPKPADDAPDPLRDPQGYARGARYRGKAVPMLNMSAVAGWRQWGARLTFWLGRTLIASGFVKLEHLRALRSIHFARWLLVWPRRFPRLADEQPPETARDAYLVFSTNYNGRWDEYIDEFVIHPTIRRGLNWLWKWTRSFPGGWPLDPFKRHIRTHDYPTHYYYNAYPEASVTDIGHALQLADALHRFEAGTRELVADTDDPDERADRDAELLCRYRELTRDYANHLGSMKPPDPDKLRPHEFIQPNDHP